MSLLSKWLWLIAFSVLFREGLLPLLSFLLISNWDVSTISPACMVPSHNHSNLGFLLVLICFLFPSDLYFLTIIPLILTYLIQKYMYLSVLWISFLCFSMLDIKDSDFSSISDLVGIRSKIFLLLHSTDFAYLGFLLLLLFLCLMQQY